MPETNPDQTESTKKFLATDHDHGELNPPASRPRVPLKFADFCEFAETINRIPKPEAE
jgi:hypothetical protein